MRKIASNLLFDGVTLHRNPVVELSDEHRVVGIRTTETPDREPLTEFYAGLLVVGLEVACLPRLLADHTTPITDRLAPYINPARDGLTLLTGLDYKRLSPTADSRWITF